MLRPSGVSAKKSPAPLIVVLFEPAKSAEPPKNDGVVFARALIASPDDERVATAVPASYTGNSEAKFSGNLFSIALTNCAANSGYSFL